MEDVNAAFLVKLHESTSGRELASRTFDIIGQMVPNFGLFLALRPIEFELPSFCSRPEFQGICDEYISNINKYDIWLKRGPIHPGIKIVRHSDHTPLSLLMKSRFYKEIMSKIGCSYGLSMVAWNGTTWLSTLTLFRQEEQGDISDKEMAMLFTLQLHFESAARRVAQIQENKLGVSSLEQFIAGLPTAAIVLDWDLKVLHSNAVAEDLCLIWRFGDKAKSIKRGGAIQVPGDILEHLMKQRDTTFVDRKFQGNLITRTTPIVFSHAKIEGLSVKISFVPSRNLSLSKGTFLLALQHQPSKPDERQVYDLWALLSRREREVVKLAIAGKNGAEIGASLGTAAKTVRLQLHNVYRKLGIKTRFELIALFSNFNV